MASLSVTGEAAQDYVRRGLSVLELKISPPAQRKRPEGASWKEWQTRRKTAEEAEAIWTNRPDAGVGIVCGEISGVVAVDIDSDNAREWATANLPPTEMRTLSPTGGEHWFYRLPPGQSVRNRVKIKPGGVKIALDVRGEGGQVVAAPSLHPNGGRYSLAGCWPPIDELPMFDLAWLQEAATTATTAPTPTTASLPLTTGNTDRSMKRAVAWMAKRAPAVQGSGGDHHTFVTACELVRGFGLHPRDALGLLVDWNLTCQPPWSTAELQGKIRNAIKHGASPMGGKLAEGSSDFDPDYEPVDDMDRSCDEWEDDSSRYVMVPPGRKKPPPPMTSPPLDAPPGSPAAPNPVLDSGGRIELMTGNDVRDMRDVCVQALLGCDDVFVSSGLLARIGPDERIETMTRGVVESMLADTVEFRREMKSGDVVPAAIPDWLPRMTMAMPSVMARQFRQVDQVQHVPYWTASGVAIDQIGYNEETRTMLLENPGIDLDAFYSAEEAKDWIYEELVSDFPFASTAERANYLGAMLVPMVRKMIDGPVPLHNFEANKPGTGKSYLARMIHMVYGLKGAMGTLPEREEEAQKHLLSVLIAGDPVHVFDNVKHKVESAGLEAVLTSNWFSGRILGVNKNATVPVLTFFLMTSNNARFGPDMVRRMVRCRLVTPLENPQDRRGFKHDNLLKWVKANRAMILSALWRMVHDWVELGMTQPEETVRRALGSYNEWSDVIGGILLGAGETEWLLNLKEARDEANTDQEEWPAFLETWWQEHGHDEVSSKQLWQMCENEDLMMSARGSKTEHSQILRLASNVKKARDSVAGPFIVRTGKSKRTKTAVFWLDHSGQGELPDRYERHGEQDWAEQDDHGDRYH